MAGKSKSFNRKNVIFSSGLCGKKASILISLFASVFLSACGAQFQTIDTRVPTTSNPFEAEKFSIDLDLSSSDDEQAVASFCDSENLNGFTSAKKKEFVCSLLPGAIRMSKQVYKQRLQIKAIQLKSLSAFLAGKEIDWLSRIKMDYNLQSDAIIDEVLARVDIVPLPLIIAQAAIESGWGTSRAALQGKNLFGIHGTFGKDQCLTAKKNKSVCIKKYGSVVEGISDYIQFLNTKKSAEDFRQKRAGFRAARIRLDPIQLAETLHLYSERGTDYVRYVQNMMIDQKFVRFEFTESGN